MALVLVGAVKEQTETILFQDATGIYDATDNPTGYGAPNGTIAGATAATILVTMPDDTTVTLNVYSSFPVNDKSWYEITLTDLGIEFIESGYWTFLYTVTTGGTAYTATVTCLFVKNTECCVNQRMLKVTPDNASNPFSLETILLGNMITAALSANCQGLTDYAENTIEYVKTKCEGCCCC